MAVVALAIAGRGAPEGAPVDRAADVARAEPSSTPVPVVGASPAWRSDWPAAIAGAQRLASDEYRNRFTIDDLGTTKFVATPPWVRALGVIGRHPTDPFQR